ncbi:hypothetical protein [Streptomyces fradiae]|uniref:hypothetical protein n=1 Tax=Streptomyces fradiae TaxID=1906 RepID=UPI002941D21D|nr:hypothetical protein [Streptomyces fradiae]WOI60912.1 hypothetical protein RYQ63_13945 [Streptomyces fradiae]
MSALNPVPAHPARRREVVLRIALPNIPACTATLGTGSVGAALVHGTIPAASPSCGRSWSSPSARWRTTSGSVPCPPHRPTSLPDGSEVLLGLGECGPPLAYPALGLTLASWASTTLCPAQLVPGARDRRLDDACLDLGEARPLSSPGAARRSHLAARVAPVASRLRAPAGRKAAFAGEDGSAWLGGNRVLSERMVEVDSEQGSSGCRGARAAERVGQPLRSAGGG